MNANESSVSLSRILVSFQRYIWSARRNGRTAARTGTQALYAFGPKRYYVFCHDLTMALIAFHVALFADGGLSMSLFSLPVSVGGGVFALFAAAAVFAASRLHDRRWLHLSRDDTAAIAKTAFLQTLFLSATWSLIPSLPSLSVGIAVVNWGSLTALLLFAPAAVKLLGRNAAGGIECAPTEVTQRTPVLLVGAGDNVEEFIKFSEHDATCPYKAVGVVDEMGPYLRSNILGVEILGRISEIPIVVKRLASRGLRPRVLVVAEERLSAETMRMLLDEATRSGLSLRRAVRMRRSRLADQQRVGLRPVSIEELLDRHEWLHDTEGVRKLVADRRVLVTGAGGRLGGEVARQILRFSPAHLTLVGSDESTLYDLSLDLQGQFPGSSSSFALCDVCDRDTVRKVFARCRPQLVIHAAAIIHVPVAETHPGEAALTNVLGVRYFADACVEFGASAMLLVSTDEAGQPGNILGKTRRLAEAYCQLLDQQGTGRAGAPRMVSLRLPNVLGVTGSVILRLSRQLATGGPLTISDPNAARCFVSAESAAKSILDALVIGLQEPPRDSAVYAIEKPSPLKIRDLAVLLVRLAGLTPDRDVEIRYSGARPGEQIHDSSLSDKAILRRFEATGICQVSAPALGSDRLVEGIEELAAAAQGGAEERVRSLLDDLIAEPSEAPKTSFTESAALINR